MKDVSKGLPGGAVLFEKVYLSCFYGCVVYLLNPLLTGFSAKIGVLGLNGAGKSSLMKIIAGVDEDFEGEVDFPGDPQVGYLEQVSHSRHNNDSYYYKGTLVR